MKHILITGANGQLGTEIASLQHLFADFEILLTDVHNLDICDEAQLNHFFENHSIEWVVNCAAYTAVDKAETEIESATKVNAIAPALLAKACKKYHCSLIHVSTDFVFDGNNNKPYTEDDEAKPIGIYGLSKFKGEQEIRQNLNEHFILRTSWLYSPIGNNFMKTMIRLGKEKPSLNVVFDQVGTPTYAHDLALFIAYIINSGVTQYGTYHYSNEGVCSWYDFAREIMILSGSACNVYPIESKDYPTPAKRPSYSVLNKAKAKNVFGIQIPHWRKSLEDCYRRYSHLNL